MRILIAEDDPISQKVLDSTLKKRGYDVVVTHDGQQAVDCLKNDETLRLVVLDWMMPQLSGPEVCQTLRAMPGGDYYYFILLTAKGRKEDIIEGLQAGADDYLVKPFDPRELTMRVRCGQRIVELQQQLLAARDALKIQATHDALTGLLNRGALFDALVRELSRSQREQAPLAVVMIDLDHFKSINDSHGHAAGDAVLRQAADRMRVQARAYDHVGRYGGEEFMLVLPNTSPQEGLALAERLRRTIAEQSFPIHHPPGELPVTASLGMACCDGLTVATPDDLANAADHALYAAKAGGRNRVETQLGLINA
jgi:diguanylate cyclase (GGDEF)-like protein